MDKRSILIIILLIISAASFYFAQTIETDNFTAKIQKVTDGDTIILENNQILRLKGINTPEKNQSFYDEAKNFLSQFQDKEILIVPQGTDKYDRLLAYVYVENELINKKILENGLANLYYYDSEDDEKYEQMKQAEDHAKLNQLGIWKFSKDSGCIQLVELIYKETKRCQNQEILKIQNICNKTIYFIIKDDANHISEEKITANSNFEKNFSCAWNDEGDSLFIRNKNDSGLMVFIDTKYSFSQIRQEKIKNSQGKILLKHH